MSIALPVSLGITRRAQDRLHAYPAQEIPTSLKTDRLPACNVMQAPLHTKKLEALSKKNVRVIQPRTTWVKAAWIAQLGSDVLAIQLMLLLPWNMANQNGLQNT